MIEFQNVSKVYGDKEALSNLNLQIENGEIMGLIGHNGAGKIDHYKILSQYYFAQQWSYFGRRSGFIGKSLGYQTKDWLRSRLA